VNIRRAVIDDIEAITTLFEAYRRFYRQPADPAKARAFILDRLNLGDSVIFLADDDGNAVGFTQLYPLFSSTACRRLWLLNDLYVSEKSRGRGIARALVEAARVHAVETGACGLELATAHTNLTAQRLYESLGWKLDESFRHYELRF
jgi:ribosomal protein S18 acetylase RimI-like enzyme